MIVLNLISSINIDPSTNMLRERFIVVALMLGFMSTSCSDKAQSVLLATNDIEVIKMVSKIDTYIDPQYIYEYEKSKYVPPKDRTLLIIGQSLKNIKEYSRYAKTKGFPAGWSAYWPVNQYLGIEESFKSPSGDIQNHQFLVGKYENTVLHSAMWLVGKWGIARKTINGEYDHVILRYSNWAKSINRPIYLRIGYEFDGPHNELAPSEYVKAYKHIVDIMCSEGVTNVAFIWHSYASIPYNNYQLSDWYPGDDYVDWVAISVFFQPYENIFNHKETNDVLEFAKTKKKPVMVAESNPVLGIKKNDKNIWDNWFIDFFTFCYQKNIKAIAFINEDWKSLSIEGIESWGDSKLYNNKLLLQAWFQETTKARYLRQSDSLFRDLNYSKSIE